MPAGRKEAGAAELEVALAQHVRVHSRHQQRLQTEMEQPWSGPGPGLGGKQAECQSFLK